jgi:leader peptidase (prepilin peptidase) / N-methyltransferase
VVPALTTGVFGFAIGASIASFVGVVRARRPLAMSVVSPPSHCLSCSVPLAWFDNVPVVSWLVLRGRCRHCGAAVPVRVLLGEIGGGLIGATVAVGLSAL